MFRPKGKPTRSQIPPAGSRTSVEIAALDEAANRAFADHRQVARHGKALAELPKLGAEIEKALRHDMHHEALALQPAAHDEEARGHGGLAVRLEDVAPDDDVRDAGLVFKRHEHHALRRTGALADQHDAGDGEG